MKRLSGKSLLQSLKVGSLAAGRFTISLFTVATLTLLAVNLIRDLSQVQTGVNAIITGWAILITMFFWNIKVLIWLGKK